MPNNSLNLKKSLIFVYLLLVVLLTLMGLIYYNSEKGKLINKTQEGQENKVRHMVEHFILEAENIKRILEDNKEVKAIGQEYPDLKKIYNAMGGTVYNVFLSDSKGNIVAKWPNKLIKNNNPKIKVELNSSKNPNATMLSANINLGFILSKMTDHFSIPHDSGVVIFNNEDKKVSLIYFDNNSVFLDEFVQSEDYLKINKSYNLSSRITEIKAKTFLVTQYYTKIGSSLGLVISAVPYIQIISPLLNLLYFGAAMLIVLHLFGIIIYNLLERKRNELTSKEKNALIAVNNSAGIIASSLELNQVLEKILDEVQGLFKPSKSTIYQLKDEEFLTLITYKGFKYGQKPFEKLKLGQYISGKACLENKIISTNEESFSEIFLVEQYYNTKAAMSAPLCFKGVNLGALTIFFEKKKYFSNEEINNLSLFANHAAIAIENARLYTRSIDLQNKVKDMAVNEERNRIARELHDSLSQSLFSMVFHCEAVLNQYANDNKLHAMIAQLKKQIQDAQTDMRGLVFELHPQSIFEKSLKFAINNLVQRFSNINPEVEIDFRILTNVKINSTIQLNLYRVIQENLTNISKYAQATKVQIRLTVKNDRIFLIIRDNGIGFDPDRLNKGGLIYMKERIYSLNGKLKIFSKKGTLICVMVPLGGVCQ